MKKITVFIFLANLISFHVILFCDYSLFSTRVYEKKLTDHEYISPFLLPASHFISNKLKSMTLREKIGQMVISSTLGEDYPESSPEYKRLSRLCTRTKVGGFIFFKGNTSGYSRLSNKLQQSSDTPLLISSDFERGTGMRLTDGTTFPNNMAIGATRNTELAYRIGLQISKEARLLGVHQNYAPVCDVNNNQNNPIINVRSFGEDPELVSVMSAAMINGLQEGRLIATAKHFPGHGDTEIDSHKDLPVLNFPMERLDKVELVPFKNAVEKGVMSVMVAHLSFPGLETEPNVPSSLSKNIVEGLLIDRMGFKGLVITDALNMKGITKYFSTKEVALMCINAGIDLILMPNDEEQTIDAIETAVNKGLIPESRIERSVEKILKAKEWLGLFENRFVQDADVYKLIKLDESNELSRQAASESITLVKDDNNTIPVTRLNSRFSVLSLSDGADNVNTAYFSETALKKLPNSDYSEFTTDITLKEASGFTDAVSLYDYILVGIFAKVRHGTGKISILPSHAELIRSLVKVHKNVIVVSFGNPYLLKEFTETPNYICAYGDADVSIDASFDAITGLTKINGKLPVSITPEYTFGSGLTR